MPMVRPQLSRSSGATTAPGAILLPSPWTVQPFKLTSLNYGSPRLVLGNFLHDEFGEFAGGGCGKADVDKRAIGRVLLVAHRALGVYAGHHIAAGEGNLQLDVAIAGVEEELHARGKLVDSLARARGYVDDVLVVEYVAQLGEHQRVGLVDLIDHDDLGRGLLPGFGHNVIDDLVDRLNLLEREWVRAIDHVQHDIGGQHLFQGGFEGFDQLRGQVADKADGVGEYDLAAVGKRGTASGGVQRGKECVLHQHAGAGHGVNERGLSGVGVAGNGYLRDSRALTLGTLDLTGGLHSAQLLAQPGHLRADAAAIRLDLGLTGTAQADAAIGAGAAARLARKVAAPTTGMGVEVFQLCQGDLRLALFGLGVLGKDVKDEHRAVNDLGVKRALESGELARIELAIAYHGIGAGGLDDVAQFLDLAGADEGAGIRLIALLVDHLHYFGAGGLGQRRELVHGGFDFGHGAFGPHANQDDALEAQLSILHLIAIGGVFGADGGLTGNAAEGVALCQVKVTGGGRRLWCGRGVIIAERTGEEIVVIVLGKFGHTTFHFGMLRPKAGIADS